MDGGRGGRYGYYGGGGGGRHHRNRRGGRGRGYRHQPYNNRSRGPRHGRGNRFGAGQSYQDPQTIMIRQVSSFVSRVGEFKNLKESPSPEVRAVVSTTAANINDLTTVLCAEDKLEMLLKFQDPQVLNATDSATPKDNPADGVGKLAHIVVSCASGLPLQTPGYAALTLAVHEQVKGTQYEGFAQRCVGYAMFNIARDLDTILLLGKEKSQAWCRAKMLVRYLAILGKMGVVKGYEGDTPNSSPDNMSVYGLLLRLVEAACSSSTGERPKEVANAAYVVGALVLCALPYISDYVPASVVSEKLFQPLESLFESYKSSFSPGFGMSAILLKDEQLEGDDNDDDDEEDDDDDDEETTGQICDSLQDLLKASQLLTKGGEQSRFCVPVDAPWQGLQRQTTPNPESGDVETHPLSFSEDPIFLNFPKSFESLELLLRGEGQLNLQCFDLDGIAFARLPIFGSAPDPDDDDEEDMDAEAPMNEQLKAFVNGYAVLDRYFVSETIRDCLISHESHVSPTGVQHGSARSAAEELLSVHHVFAGENSQAGMEYAILEVLLALIAQSSEQGPIRRSFLASVILELTRLEPSRFSPALAVAMTNLFQDYLPALVPSTRDNFSRWFAYHLINTDYQWPGAFWKAWEPYATSPKASSRGDFVRRALNVMADNVSDLAVLKAECLAGAESLSVELLQRSATGNTGVEGDEKVAALKAEIHRRLWDNNEDPVVLRDYLVGEEASQALDGSNRNSWPLSSALINAITDPARRMGQELQESLKGSDDDANAMEQDVSKDGFTSLAESIARYKDTIVGTLTTEAEKLASDSGGDKGEMIAIGQSFILQAIEKSCGFSAAFLEGTVASLLQHGILGPMGVARWGLGDLGDAAAAEVVPRWWSYTLDAVREQLDSLDAKNGGTGMDTEEGGNEATVSIALEQLSRIVHYSVKRACALMVAKQTDERRLTPSQVELLEGTKKLTNYSVCILIECLAKKAVSPNEVHVQLSTSQLSSSVLSALCTGHESNKAVGLLRRSFLSV